MPQLLPCVEIEPETPAKRTVIWLHGLGADGNDFAPIVPHLRLSPDLAVRFVLPHAPRIPVTLNGGLVMRAWFDLAQDGGLLRPDELGVVQSAEHIRALIDREQERGIEAGHIVLAGFSQGGSVVLYLGVRHPDTFSGILALSTDMVSSDSLEAERCEANHNVPIFLAHGTHDPLIGVERGIATRDRLVALGYPVHWREYPMQHEVCPEEIEDIGRWLGSVFR